MHDVFWDRNLVRHVVSFCANESDRDKLGCVNRLFAQVTKEIRRELYQDLAQKPYRYTREVLPTFDELLVRGCAKPNPTAILKTFGHDARTLPWPDCSTSSPVPLLRFYTQYAHHQQPSTGVAVIQGELCSIRHGIRYHYVGETKGGFAHGFGRRSTFVVGNNLLVREEIGTFFEGELHGLGVMFSYDGALREGMFFHGEQHGLGIRRVVDGSLRLFYGEFWQDKYHGMGQAIYADGHSYTGMWQDDVVVKRQVSTGSAVATSSA